MKQIALAMMLFGARKDGAYVPRHRATNPDGRFSNNYSTKPNRNPYTGKDGTHINLERK